MILLPAFMSLAGGSLSILLLGTLFVSSTFYIKVLHAYFKADHNCYL
jgi:hypothetical protein